MDPYLQQLARYDAREINSYKTAIDLSTDIVVKCLKTGMLLNENEDKIKEYIRCFIDPEGHQKSWTPDWAGRGSEGEIKYRQYGRSGMLQRHIQFVYAIE